MDILFNLCSLAVIRQALYQVGELSVEDRPNLAWHEVLENEVVLSKFLEILKQLVHIIEISPHQNVSRYWVKLQVF